MSWIVAKDQFQQLRQSEGRPLSSGIVLHATPIVSDGLMVLKSRLAKRPHANP